MPKVTVCKKCSGTGKIGRKSKKGAAGDATIFLLCRPCKGTGWMVLMQHRVPCAILPTERAQDAK